MKENQRKMSEVNLKPMKLNSDYSQEVKNKNDYVSDSESENESELSIKINNGIWKNIEIDHPPNHSLSNNMHPKSDAKINIENVTVESSSHTMFGNKTIYNAPVTINQIDINDKQNPNKYKCQYSSKTVFLIIIPVILIFLSLFTLTFILKHKNDENDEPFGKWISEIMCLYMFSFFPGIFFIGFNF